MQCKSLSQKIQTKELKPHRKQMEMLLNTNKWRGCVSTRVLLESRSSDANAMRMRMTRYSSLWLLNSLTCRYQYQFTDTDNGSASRLTPQVAEGNMSVSWVSVLGLANPAEQLRKDQQAVSLQYLRSEREQLRDTYCTVQASRVVALTAGNCGKPHGEQRSLLRLRDRDDQNSVCACCRTPGTPFRPPWRPALILGALRTRQCLVRMFLIISDLHYDRLSTISVSGISNLTNTRWISREYT